MSAADLDELYRGPASEFVAARNRIAKELRAAGEREEAERVKSLRRPSAAAALLNRAALTEPEVLRDFASAAEALERAQRRALEGDDDGAASWRAAVAREREASEAVVAAANRAARELGDAPAKRAFELVDETLRAAAADPGLRERIISGRLEREQSAATLGAFGTVLPPGKLAPESKKEREAVQARRDLRRLEHDLAEAEAREERLRARVAEATEALREEKAALAAGKRETAEIRRAVKAAGRRAKGQR